MKMELICNQVKMEMLLANLWWYFVTVTTLFCVTVATTWIMKVATEKYLIVYRCTNNKQPIKLFEDTKEVTDDFPLAFLFSKDMKSRPLVRRIKSRPLVIQDPYYVKENRTNRKNGLRGICSLPAIREEYCDVSLFY